MTKSKLRAAKAALKRVEKIKGKIAVMRDALRAAHSDLEDVLCTLDDGLESVDDGVRGIEFGIDTMSELL